MAVSIAQYVDLLVKKLQGVAKTANAAVKGASNESIASPLFLRGDIVWMQANQIPATAQSVGNIVLNLTGTNAVECVADNTVPPIGGIAPTWLTNTTYWIPQELGSTWLPKVYVGPPSAANIEATGTQIFAAGIGGAGEYYFDPQAGVLNFIGETIPAVLTSGNVVYVSGYQYTGLLGVTNIPNNSNIGNINITDTTISSITASLVTIGGNSGLSLPAGNTAQRPPNPTVGTTRFDTTTNSLETWDGVNWVVGGNVLTPGAIVDQQITPDGVSNTYTLDQDTISSSIMVAINGLNQVPNVAYTVTGNSITFSETPLVSDFIDVRFINYFATISSLSNYSGNSSVSITPSGNIQFTTANTLFATITNANTFVANGNITAPYFFGNIVGNISGNFILPGNTNEVIYNNNDQANASSAFTFDPGSNVLTIGGNIVANNFTGNGFALNTIRGANVTGTVANAAFATSAATAVTVTANAQSNITSVGALTLLSVVGNIDSGNILITGIVSSTGNISSNGNVSATGNVTGNNIVGSQIFSTGDGVYTGNISAAYFTGNGSQLTGLPNSYSNANVSTYLEAGLVGNIIPLGNSVYTLGNTTNQWADIYVSNASIYFDNVALSSNGNTISFAGNQLVSVNTTTVGNVTIAGNLSGSNISTAGTITANGNITVGNISTTGIVSGNQFVGNGNALTNIQGANVVGSVGNATFATLASFAALATLANSAANATFATSAATANTIINAAQPNVTSVGSLTSLSVIGNINSGNILTTGIVSSTGNATHGNILTAGNVSAAGTITAAGNITGGNVLTGGTVSAVGNITAPYFIGNLIGNISGNLTVPGANTQVLYNNNGQANASAGLTFDFNSNSLVSTGTVTGSNFLTNGQVSAGGNVTAARFIGNAALLSSITAANVTGTVANAAFATTAGTTATITANAQPNITTVGTLTSLTVSGNAASGNLTTGGIISATGNITTAGFFIGNFQGNISGNLTVPGANTQVLFNNNGNAGASAGLTFDSSSNALVSTGTVTGSNFLTAGQVSAGGNVTAARFVGNAALLSSITGANVTGVVANATFATSAATAATVTTNAQPNITSVGTLTSLTVSGNATGGNLTTGGQVSATGNITTAGFFLGTFAGNISGNLTVPGANTQLIYNNNGNAGASAGLTFDSSSNALVSTGTVTGSNFLTSGLISATGTVTGGQFIGSGNALSNIQGANVSGTVANATFATSAATAVTVTGNAQPNITSVGTLTSLVVTANTTSGNVLTGGQVSATGNITTAGFFLGTFAGNISGNLTVPGANTQLIYNNNGNAGASAGLTFNSGTNVLSVSGNTNSGNILTAGIISATGNITGGNVNATTHTGTAVSVTGSVTGGQFIGSGNTLSNIQGANVAGNVSSAIVAGTVTANAQSNITSVGTLTSLTVSGNATGGNLTTGGQVSATGNITTAGFFLGTFAGNISGNLTVPGSNTQLIYNNNGNAGASAGLTFNAASNALVSSGNITGGNIVTAGVVSSTGNVLTLGSISATSNVIGGNVTTPGLISATGSITGNQFVGNGNTLSNIQGANVSGTVATATLASSVTTNAQPNITSVGTLTSLAVTANTTSGNVLTGGIISATGNIITAGFFIGNFQGNISGNLTVPGANTQVLFNNSGNAGASAGLTFDSASNILSVGGNVSGNYFIGNGSQLTGIGRSLTIGTRSVPVIIPLTASGSFTVSTRNSGNVVINTTT